VWAMFNKHSLKIGAGEAGGRSKACSRSSAAACRGHVLMLLAAAYGACLIVQLPLLFSWKCASLVLMLACTTDEAAC
jgi:hypothetical protein